MKSFVVILCLSLTIPSPAAAQTMALYVDAGGTLTREHDVLPVTPFDVLTTLDSGGHDVSAIEWVQTDLVEEYPGMVRLNATTISCSIDLAIEPPGEFVLWVCGGCAPASEQLELARLTYMDLAASLGSDVVMTIRGFGPGDTYPSSFDGSPGFLDCSQAGFTAIMQGGEAWLTGAGVEVPSGALVLNPTPPLVVGNGSGSFSLLKSTFAAED
jgi:hypothetical protein